VNIKSVVNELVSLRASRW